ncbi:OsmC family protein [Streptococcus mutans]|jgi:osmC/ohr family protein|uniref:OsmC family protein n=1 Tax=Streptococcus mutans TaxID=1309 RepID=UPI0002B5C328|nr:OsmC family protein [Streptococcus mutans]EMC60237.1 organic hydroperoxide resistance protein, putative [Streptococcus mutans M230]MCB5035202.1 OsmC family protein [Streptococcus mutans]MDT9501334.1 OsmC family protein [Streptococcus mutans]MDT9553538.1 OsmC family protein [Streptococcus mutans]MDT9573479.1 OsmC family protein [Streptococcus mutans]
MIYQTIATNSQGLRGRLDFSDHASIETQHPLDKGTGFNPEQLIASAWATCLNATIETLLEAQGKSKHSSKVEVRATLNKETSKPGYYFALDARVTIAGMTVAQAEKIVKEAHQRCPVSKLLQQSPTVTLKVEDGESL